MILRTVLALLTISGAGPWQLSRIGIHDGKVNQVGKTVNLTLILDPAVYINRLSFDENAPSAKNTVGMPAAVKMLLSADSRQLLIAPLWSDRGARFAGLVDFEKQEVVALPPLSRIADVLSFRLPTKVYTVKSEGTNAESVAFTISQLNLATDKWENTGEAHVDFNPRRSKRWGNAVRTAVAALDKADVVDALTNSSFKEVSFRPFDNPYLDLNGSTALVHYSKRSRSASEVSRGRVGILSAASGWELQSLGEWQSVFEMRRVNDSIIVFGTRYKASLPTLTVLDGSSHKSIVELEALSFAVSGKGAYTDILSRLRS